MADSADNFEIIDIVNYTHNYDAGFDTKILGCLLHAVKLMSNQHEKVTFLNNQPHSVSVLHGSLDHEGKDTYFSVSLSVHSINRIRRGERWQIL